jgi:uncharacterized membrane protein
LKNRHNPPKKSTKKNPQKEDSEEASLETELIFNELPPEAKTIIEELPSEAKNILRELPSEVKGIIKGIPPDKVKQLALSFSREIHHQGPLPPASEFVKYEDAFTGSADRILKLAENEAAHRHQMENKAIDYDLKLADKKIDKETFNLRTGLSFGFLIGLASIIGGTYCIIQGHDWSGFGLGAGGLTGLVSTFVYGSTQSRNKENEKLKKIVKTDIVAKINN